MAERDLDRELSELSVAWPPTPALADAVGRRLRAADPRRRWRRAVVPASALALLAGGLTFGVSAQARTAVLEWLGLRSVRIERREPSRDAQAGRNLGLGSRVSLERARAAVPFTVRVPETLGPPDAVHLAAGPRVSLVYARRPGRPRLLVQQLEATATPLIEKSAGAATRVERLTIAGTPAYFLRGAHGFALIDRRGVAIFESRRLAGNTLLFERDGVLVRIEGAVSRASAVRIARSLR
jgi:hypothetical protein